MNKIPLIILFSTFLLWITPQKGFTQAVIHIALVSDAAQEEESTQEFVGTIKTEIELLLRNRYSFVFSEYYTAYNMEATQQTYDQLFRDTITDIIIGIGPSGSGLLSLRKSFPKPALASIVLDQQLQKIPSTPEGSSGVPNFSYIGSPFNFERDIQTLHEIYPFQKLGIIGDRNLLESSLFLNDLMGNIISRWNADFVLIPFQGSVDEAMNALPADVDAIYLLPLLTNTNEATLTSLLQRINDRKLPSAAIFGESYLQAGALMAHESEQNLLRIARRLALNVLKIIEGTNPSELPVSMETYNENLLINMATARQTQIYPNFDIMSRATLVNINKIPTDRTLNLLSAIAEALQQNLGLKIAAADPKIAEKDIALAKSNLLPQVDLTTSLSLLDKNTASTSFGRQGRLNWLASGNLSQLIYSEPALANIAIQQLLKESADQALTQTQMDGH